MGTILDRLRNTKRVTLKKEFSRKYPSHTFILDYFAQAVGKPATWENLTKLNLQKFVDHMAGTLAPNSVNQYCTLLKVVLNMCADEIKLPGDYGKILSPRKIASTAVYLTEEELSRLESYTPKNDNEQFVRNMFLVSSYTGARHIDAINMNESNIRGNKLVFVAQKTRKEAVLPLKPIVADYIRSTPRLELSDVGYNKIIRRICRNVGITERVKILKAGKEVELDKCDAVSSHTARRTFAVALYNRGVDIYTISKMLQHSSIELTKKYLCDAVRQLNERELEYFS